MTDNTERDALAELLFYTDPNGKRVFKYADPRIVEDEDDSITALIPAVIAWLRENDCEKREPVAPFDDDIRLLDTPALAVRADDAIQNIDYPGSDSPLWEAKARALVRELVRRGENMPPVVVDDAIAVAKSALAFWNNGRGHHDAAWVSRHAFNMADALRGLLAALTPEGQEKS